uniref:DNA helicase n=1 Tax=Candidatus Methanophagaceae archaeon ANME-1 ERB6 TaxID=2759912 RepID=A0A7G9Z1F2_9EURY|nr:RecBCD enzyme subunit RecD [Methanosarcinales archaeon ANME-1 ERB6]
MNENEYVRHFTDLVELEREEQMRLHEEEMRRLSGREREEKGRAFLRMKGKSQGLGLGGKHLVKFRKQNAGFTLPDSEIEVGDLVLVSKTNPWDEDNPTGTVAEKTSYFLTVAFDEAPPGFAFRKDLRIDLFVNDITFQRMIEALKKFKRLPRRRKDKLLGNAAPDFEKVGEIEFFNQELNKSQREAVLRSLAARDFFLIHGPPGTGKTITCIEIIAQLVEHGREHERSYNILAAADSNVAVDNLVERLDKIGVNVVRIGHPARVIPSLRKRSLDYLIQEEPEYIKAQELRENAYEIKERMKSFIVPEMRWRRGLSDEAIMQLAREGRTIRGIPKHKIEGMRKWLDLKHGIDKLFGDARELEEKAVKRIILEAEVICATNSTVGSEILKGAKFDLAVIDEATQSTEPSSLISVLKTKRFIMAGDHKQLPPTILNENAARGNLSRSLFERLLEMYGDKIRVMLDVQYRMNDAIAEFPGKEFYDGKLRADESVKKHNLFDLLPESKLIDEDAKPFLFIDTGGSERFKERTRRGSTSKENAGEAKLVEEIAERLLSLGVKPEDIAVISPYDDQVALIRKELRVEGLEIKTVDGFQGREKEVVIVSFVRSNKSREIGFLRDLRRLNVSITRAKRKLVLIGDSHTLEREGCYKRLVALAKERGGYKRVVSAQNSMEF